MASIILSSAGATVGNAIMPGLGGKLMRSAGSKLGSVLDKDIGWTSSSKDGQQLENFEVQDSCYGVAIPKVFGRARVAGNVIWASDLIETSHKEGLGSGKGGSVATAFSSSSTTYTYSLHAAIAICAGEVGKIETIWADSNIIYQNGIWEDGIVASSSIHLGSDDQGVDPLLESWIGTGDVPSYKGIAYIVLESLELSNFGNRMPNLTFEIAPVDEDAVSEWTGEISPEISVSKNSNKMGGTPPLAVDSFSGRASHMIVGGYVGEAAQTTFKIVGYDVTGDEPDEHYSVLSDSFAVEAVMDHCWAMSSDNRYVAVCVQDTGSANDLYVMLYDMSNRSFGDVLAVPMGIAEQRQVTWLDAYHFALSDVVNATRGVRVFMRTGSSVVEVGFYPVWGSSSASTHFPVGYTQFRPYGDGVMHYMANSSGSFTQFYGVYLTWYQNQLKIGTPFDVSTGHSFGSGAGAVIHLLETGDQEWTLLYLNVLNMQMMSFVPTQTGVTVTRPWQTIYSNVWFVTSGNVPVANGGAIYILHLTNVESSYRLSKVELGDGVFNLVSDAPLIDEFDAAAVDFGVVSIDTTRLIVLGNSGVYDEIHHLGFIKLQETSECLDQVVGTLLKRAGYEESDYDVSALSDVKVDGYAISKQLTIASALQPLQYMEAFDLVERSGCLVAQKHGYGQRIEVDEGELGAYGEGEGEETESLSLLRTQQLDLPLEVSVNYLDATRDYEIGSQCARRSVSKGAMEVGSLNLPLVCTAAFAKQLAQKLLYRIWTERDVYNLSLSREWMGVEPGDIVVCRENDIRVTVVSYKDGIVQVEGVAAVPESFASYADAEAGDSSFGEIAQHIPTQLYLLDLPLLRLSDDEAGVYVAATGLDGWKGGSLWRAEDGVSFARQLNFSSAAKAGSVSTVLSDASPHYRDNKNSLCVQLIRGELSSCSEADLMNGVNVALCGREIIQYQTALLLGDGYYELSGLLRGRRGTHIYSGEHDVGEAFVLLQESALQFLPAPLTDRNKSYHYRGVTNGGSIEYAQDHSFTFGMEALKPLAPCHIRGARVGDDLSISWVRCARKNAAWVDYIDVPLDDDRELYDVEIMDGGDVVHSFDSVEEARVMYSAVAQVSDWGVSVPDEFDVRVWQVSSRYGRGEVGLGVVG